SEGGALSRRDALPQIILADDAVSGGLYTHGAGRVAVGIRLVHHPRDAAPGVDGRIGWGCVHCTVCVAGGAVRRVDIRPRRVARVELLVAESNPVDTVLLAPPLPPAPAVPLGGTEFVSLLAQAADNEIKIRSVKPPIAPLSFRPFI